MLSSCASFSVREQASPVALPYENSSMDFVTSVCVYHHVHGNDRTLLTREIRRVLAPGGLYCIVEHNPWNPVTRTIVGRCAVDVDAELLSAPNAAGLMKDGGFDLLRTSYFLYLPEQLFGHFAAMESVLERVPLGGQYAFLAGLPFRGISISCDRAKSLRPTRIPPLMEIMRADFQRCQSHRRDARFPSIQVNASKRDNSVSSFRLSDETRKVKSSDVWNGPCPGENSQLPRLIAAAAFRIAGSSRTERLPSASCSTKIEVIGAV